MLINISINIYMDTSRKNILIRFILSAIFISILFSAKSDLVFTASHERRANNWYLIRNWKLFEHRAIRDKGWDWYVDNIILRNTHIGAFMIQDNDSSGILVFNTPYRSQSLNEDVKSIFDQMAINNDTVCFFTGSPYAQESESKWQKIRENKAYRDSLFDERATHCFVTLLDFATTKPYGTWNNIQSDYSASTKAYFFHPIRINTANILYTDSIVDMYVAECMSHGLKYLVNSDMRPRLLDYYEGDSLKKISDNFALLHKYVLMDDSIVLSQPLPSTKVDANFRYKANSPAQDDIMISHMDTVHN